MLPEKPFPAPAADNIAPVKYCGFAGQGELAKQTHPRPA
jgi:hypothetical protein